MNGYIAFYAGKQTEIRATTSFEAQNKATDFFQKKHPRRRVRGWAINIVLAEKGGAQVTHSTAVL